MATIFGYAATEGVAHRSKKNLTYGKRSQSNAHGDSKSKFRPHSDTKQRQDLKSSEKIPSNRVNTASLPADEFDVPSSEGEDNSHQVSNATEKIKPPTNDFEIPSSDDEQDVPITKSRKPTQLAERTKQGIAQSNTKISRVPAKESDSKSPPVDTSRKRKRVVVEQRKQAGIETSEDLALHSPRQAGPKWKAAKSPPIGPSGQTLQRARASMPVTPRKGLSAPAQLTQMVEREITPSEPAALSIVYDEDMSHEIATSSTPQTSGPRKRVELIRSVSATPAQRDLWSQLLASDSADVDLNMTHEATPRQTQSRPAIVRSPASMPAHIVPHTALGKRVRLVDRLKQANPSYSETDESEEMSSEEGGGINAESLASMVKRPSPPASRHRAPVLESQTSFSQAESTRTGPKRTYAQTRSYLQEDNFEAALLSALPTETPRPAPKSKSAFDIDSDSDQDQSQTIKSIHDLRAAGSKQRFTNDMDALLDDIKDHTKGYWSRRRSSLMELATKLHDKTFAARFVESGYDHALVKECRAVADSKGIDKIADCLLMVVLICFLSVEFSAHCVVNIQGSGILDWILTQIDDVVPAARIAKDRKNNMAKASQASFVDFMTGLQVADLWEDQQPHICTPSILALKASEMIVLKLRAQGNRIPLVTDVSTIATLVNMIAVTTSNLSTNDSRDPAAEIALSILESDSLASATDDRLADQIWKRDTLVEFANMLPSILSSLHTSRLKPLSLRLSLNLTNNKPKSCDIFADASITSCIMSLIIISFSNLDTIPAIQESQTSDSDSQTAHLDLLLLALGLLINLAEFSALVRRTAVSCSIDLLPNLVSIFVAGQVKAAEANSLEQSRSNVAYGYLAVLLGNLCLDAQAKDVVRRNLPGEDLGLLVTAVEEFVMYHQRVDRMVVDDEEIGGGDVEEVWDGFTRRLRAVVERIRDG